MIPIFTALVGMMNLGGFTLTFWFAGKSGVNAGIISCMFSSSIVFISVIFYFKYGQKLTVRDALGSVLIVASVVFIAIGGKNRDTTSDGKDIDVKNLLMAVASGLLAGLIIALNAFTLKYFVEGEHKFPADQLNLDAYTWYAIFLIPVWANEIVINPDVTLEDNLKGLIWALTFGIARILLTLAFKIGKGGTVQAIENSKSIILTLMFAVLDSMVPNWFEISGIATGTLGVLVIVLQH